MNAVRYEVARQVTPHAAVLLQQNPGPMTLEGTNTWLLRTPGEAAAIVVDPGEDGAAHQTALRAAAGNVAVILLTHRHFDHSDAAPALHEATGAPVRAFDPKLCRGGQSLEDGELIEDAGVRLRVLATPGHTSDSVCFAMESDAGEPTAVLTGDTILGRGTTVVAHPDGALGPYLDSLRALHDLGALAVLPGHGPELSSLAMVTEEYLAHREERLTQIRDALDRLGQDATARQIVEDVYAEVDRSVWWAAELSVRAQLDYLRG
jgi:glyoxylase-like metal-dependent hydrolase (beta-lactamase superfamily II)